MPVIGVYQILAERGRDMPDLFRTAAESISIYQKLL
jgi:hypothetical protein